MAVRTSYLGNEYEFLVYSDLAQASGLLKLGQPVDQATSSVDRLPGAGIKYQYCRQDIVPC